MSMHHLELLRVMSVHVFAQSKLNLRIFQHILVVGDVLLLNLKSTHDIGFHLGELLLFLLTLRSESICLLFMRRHNWTFGCSI